MFLSTPMFPEQIVCSVALYNSPYKLLSSTTLFMAHRDPGLMRLWRLFISIQGTKQWCGITKQDCAHCAGHSQCTIELFGTSQHCFKNVLFDTNKHQNLMRQRNITLFMAYLSFLICVLAYFWFPHNLCTKWTLKPFPVLTSI